MNKPLTIYIFFSGKGGVGKTTMASATAVHYALTGKKTLIVTTDPASNLSDIFEQEIGHRVTPVKGIGPDNLSLLSAMEINPDDATREYKEGIIAHVQIHDELCISVKDQEQAVKIVKIMQDAVTLEVPNKVDCELANTWGDING